MPEDISLIDYPCDFPIKVLGITQPGLAQEIVAIVMRYASDFDATTVEMRSSKQGKYLSITCTIRAVSRDQIDNLYRELCDHPMVIMVL